MVSGRIAWEDPRSQRTITDLRKLFVQPLPTLTLILHTVCNNGPITSNNSCE